MRHLSGCAGTDLRYHPTWTFCLREDELLLVLVLEAMVDVVDFVLL